MLILTKNFGKSFYRASHVMLVVKNLPANGGDTRDAGLIPGWDDPVEVKIQTHFSILVWRIPWTEEPGGYSPWGCKESDTTEAES